jgi:hypothetical protein
MIRAGSLSLAVLLTIAAVNLGSAQNSPPGSAAGQRPMEEPTSASRSADPASLLGLQFPASKQEWIYGIFASKSDIKMNYRANQNWLSKK